MLDLTKFQLLAKKATPAFDFGLNGKLRRVKIELFHVKEIDDNEFHFRYCKLVALI